jgi:hypothetical protein
VADFDGDSDLDVCASGTRLLQPPRQWLLRNDGAERFADLSATLPPANESTLCTVAFDADGDVDLFVSKLICPSRLWLNTGLGVFVDASAGLPPAATSHTRIVAGDFDGDGDLDLAAAGNALAFGRNRLLVNQGGGTFTAVDPFPGSASNAIVTADFDGDSDLDLALATWSGLVPQLSGVELHLQALLEQWPLPAHLTAYRQVVVQ